MKIFFRLPKEDGRRKPSARSGKGYTVSWATVNHVGPILALDGSVFFVHRPACGGMGKKEKPRCALRASVVKHSRESTSLYLWDRSTESPYCGVSG